MKTVVLPDGARLPALGQGTWNLGVTPARRRDEIAALHAGVALGLAVIDTAEMYGEGATERFLAEALKGLREKVFLVTKAYPYHGAVTSLARACEGSLRRLETDRIDLYLLHWRGDTPLEETVEGMRALRAAGKIRHWGVSNFDVDDMEQLLAAGGQDCVANQILYNPSRRGPEYDLLPWLERQGMLAMAYSPVEQGRLSSHVALKILADRLGAAPLQVAIAWALRRPGMIVIPKAGRVEHVRQNTAAADIALGPDDLAALDRAFPPPTSKRPLAML